MLGKATFFRSALRSLAVAATFACVLSPALSTEPENPGEFEARRAGSVADYERILREISLSDERLAALSAEIASVRKDHASLTAALLQSAKTERKLGEDVEDISQRLDELKRQEATLRDSLKARRGVLAEVLGALQRMGLNPPPALIVRPEDALSSVRSAILLGAVVPGLRSETEILMTDLRELSRIVGSIESERAKLMATARDQAGEQKRLALLIAEKRALQTQSEAAAANEKAKAAALADRAKSLNDLIASLDKELSSLRSAEEGARRAEEARRQREETLAALPVPEANRLGGPTAFSALLKQVAMPAAGRFARRFGHEDGNGGVMQGDMLATQSAAIVTAPADGSILYAGPFRSYGQLLILDVGDGYHVVLAGMDRISVAAGQSVISGEPVGAMGEARVASAANAGGENRVPELYIEFRKDGKPVDPAPWWTERLSGRTRHDS